MWWPFTRRDRAPESPTETRAAYADLVVEALVAAASGDGSGDPLAVAGVEVAAQFWAQSFAAAEVDAGIFNAAISPQFMATIAREMIRRGEAVTVLDFGDMPSFTVASSWDITGGYMETSWRYRCDLIGPSRNITRIYPRESVAHFRYAIDAREPWRGVSPLQFARSTGRLSGYLETRLGDEASGPVAQLIPIPSDGGDDDDENDPLKLLKSDITKARGKAVMVESAVGGWGDPGASSAPRYDWATKRLGANPPATLRELRADVCREITAACGVPPALVGDSDGTLLRESWRQFVLGKVAPMLRIVAAELSRVLERPVSFSTDPLYGSDLAGRATAFAKLVAGGMAVDQARQIAGLSDDTAA